MSLPRIGHRASKAVVLAIVLFASSLAAAEDAEVSVKMADFAFAVTPKAVAAGHIVFRIRNLGAVQHDFKISGKQSPVITAGQDSTLQVELVPGEYEYECTVPGHAQAGMKGVLTVR